MAALSQTVIDLLEAWIGTKFVEGAVDAVVFTWEQPLNNIAGGGPVTLYFSSTTYRTRPSHTPPNQLFFPVLESPDLGASVISSAEFRRSGSVQIGSVGLSNLNGELDEFLDGTYVWEGLEGKFMVGAPDWDYADFEELQPTSRVDVFRFDEKKITLDLNHGIANFDDVYQDDLFTYSDIRILDTAGDYIIASNGDAIGANAVQVSVGEGIIATPWPDVWGHVRNCEPVLTDTDYGPGWYRYQLLRGDGLSNVEIVYEGGLPLTDGVDYEKDLTHGGFSKFTAPAATITCQVKGRVSQPFYFDRPAAICQQILIDHVGLIGAQVDSAAVTAYDAEFDLESGIYIRDQQSPRDVLDYMMGPRGWWAPTFDGAEITFGFVSNPNDQDATVAIEQKHIKTVQRLRTLPPAWRVMLEYGRNFARVSDLLGAATADVRQWIQNEWRTTVAEDVELRLEFPEAREIRVPTPFYEEPAAEASFEVALFGERADLYKFTLGRLPASYYLGDIVSVTKDRFGLNFGKNFYVAQTRLKPTAHEFSLVGWRQAAEGPPESLGVLRIWLDDGNFTESSGFMTSMRNQARDGASTSWDFVGSSFLIQNDINGSGRKAFGRRNAGQWLLADVLETGFTTGFTVGAVFRSVSGGGAFHILSDELTPGFQGYVGVRGFEEISAQLDDGADEAITAASVVLNNVWHVVVVTVDTSQTKCYLDGSDVTIASPKIWDGLLPQPFEFQYTLLAASSSKDWDLAGLWAYDGGMIEKRVSEFGQWMADQFLLIQNWKNL